MEVLIIIWENVNHSNYLYSLLGTWLTSLLLFFFNVPSTYCSCSRCERCRFLFVFRTVNVLWSTSTVWFCRPGGCSAFYANTSDYLISGAIRRCRVSWMRSWSAKSTCCGCHKNRLTSKSMSPACPLLSRICFENKYKRKIVNCSLNVNSRY